MWGVPYGRPIPCGCPVPYGVFYMKCLYPVWNVLFHIHPGMQGPERKESPTVVRLPPPGAHHLSSASCPEGSCVTASCLSLTTGRHKMGILSVPHQGSQTVAMCLPHPRSEELEKASGERESKGLSLTLINHQDDSVAISSLHFGSNDKQERP